MPDDATTLWGSVGRAVRTPSRYDGDGVVNFAVLSPFSASNPLPLPVLVQGPGSGTRSESLIAYELGWKQRLTPVLSADLALFFNDYDKLRTSRFVAPVCQPSGLPVAAGCFLDPQQTYVLQNSPGGNEASARSHGFELSVDWRPESTLRFQLTLSELRMKIMEEAGASSTDIRGSAPTRQIGLRTGWNPRRDTDVDLWVRRIGRLTEATTTGISVPAYTEMDLRLAWRPAPSVELAIVGRNLLHNSHAEFPAELLDVPLMQIERSVFGQINWKF
jgi:iron complex outermembrane receptor protein